MDIELADFARGTAAGARAKEIINQCVHCGFCNATCPTYQILGDELDGPRGRIYQIKHLFEGAAPSPHTQRHLDRCLGCLSCETTCPSGVRYGQLLDIGRKALGQRLERPWRERLARALILRLVPYRRRIGPLIWLGQWLRPLLPAPLKEKIYPRRKSQRQPSPGEPSARKSSPYPSTAHNEAVDRALGEHRTMLLLEGCVQPSMAPNIDAATRRVLARLGIRAVTVAGSGCCGAINYHLQDHHGGKQRMRALIDACWPYVEDGAEAIVSTASGCGATVKEYAEILRDDPVYAAKAARISALCKDIVEIVQAEPLAAFAGTGTAAEAIRFHPPCTLQHGQRQTHRVETLLGAVRLYAIAFQPIATFAAARQAPTRYYSPC